MSTPARDLLISAEEYLEFENASEERHEYVNGRVFARVGSTQAHSRIVNNLHLLIASQIRSSGCWSSTTDLKLKVAATNSFYYPDLIITCEPYVGSNVFITSPCLVAEVLSPSTQNIDLREKMTAYRTIAGLTIYLIVYQDERRIELYSKSATDQTWQASVFQGADDFMLKPTASLELSVNLDDIYEGVI